MIAYCPRRAVLVVLLCAATSAFAQTFPSRPITLYLPFIPGPTDSMARKFAEVAARHLGQPIVVENKPGAGGTLAPALMSRTAKPDGYTLTIMSSSLFRYPYMQKVDWDPIQDFTYIAGLATDSMSIEVQAASPFRSFDDVVRWARANPGRLSYGTPGAGTSMHLVTEAAAGQLGIQLLHVPYKGGSDVMRALLGGEIMIAVDTAGTMFTQVAAGKARYLMQFNEKRSRWLPEVPTAREVGLDMVVTVPLGIGGPRGVPEPVVNRLHEAFSKAIDDPETLKVLDTLKKDPWPMTPAAYTAWAKESYRLERAMVERAGMMAK